MDSDNLNKHLDKLIEIDEQMRKLKSDMADTVEAIYREYKEIHDYGQISMLKVNRVIAKETV